MFMEVTCPDRHIPQISKIKEEMPPKKTKNAKKKDDWDSLCDQYNRKTPLNAMKAELIRQMQSKDAKEREANREAILNGRK